MFDSTTIINCL